MANFCYELCTRFNEFYQLVPVLKSEAGLKAARLALVEAFSCVLKNALDMLGIGSLERM